MYLFMLNKICLSLSLSLSLSEIITPNNFLRVISCPQRFIYVDDIPEFRVDRIAI